MNVQFLRFLSIFFASTSCVLAWLPFAQAQNYINPIEYANPNVLIDLDVIERPDPVTVPQPRISSSPKIFAPASPQSGRQAIPTPEGLIRPARSATQNTTQTPQPAQKVWAAKPQKTQNITLATQPPRPVSRTIPPVASKPKRPEPVQAARPQPEPVKSKPVAQAPKQDIPSEANIIERFNNQLPTVPKPDMPYKEPADIKVASAEPVLQQEQPQQEVVHKVPEKTSSAIHDIASGQPIRVFFDTDAADLMPDDQEKLDAVASKLKSTPSKRVQLKAFAAGSNETASSARRLSLTRALQVRSYLMDQGMRATQMDVRALGTGSALEKADQDGLSPDRVDVVILD